MLPEGGLVQVSYDLTLRHVSEHPQWEQFLKVSLEKYFLKNDFSADANPKALRTLIWRTICNMSKFAHGQSLLKKLHQEIFLTAAKTMQDHKTDATLTNAATLALSNCAFIKVDLTVNPGVHIQFISADLPCVE